MAQQHRVEKIASVIREVVSDAIANRLSDPRISPLASVTRVEVAGDLQTAHVYISVIGPEADERKTVAALDHAAGRVQKLLGGRLRSRQCPRLAFAPDPSIKRGAETIRMIDAAMRELDETAAPHALEADDPGAVAPADAHPEAAS